MRGDQRLIMGGLTLALICVAATGLLVVTCERHE